MGGFDLAVYCSQEFGDPVKRDDGNICWRSGLYDICLDISNVTEHDAELSRRSLKLQRDGEGIGEGDRVLQ